MSRTGVCSDIALSGIDSDDNSRVKMDVSELMSSIKQHGVLQPIGVVKKGSRYKVVFGNRRYAAAKKLKMKSVPCVKITADQAKNEEILNLVENLQRVNPNVFSLARYMQRLIDDGYSKAEVASLIDKPLNFVRSCLMALENVPAEYRSSVVMAKHGAKAKGIPLSTINMIESTHRQIDKTQKKAIYKMAKHGDQSSAEINRVCKMVANGDTVQQALKQIRTYETYSVSLNIHKNDFKKLDKYAKTTGSYSEVIGKILSGEIVEKIRTV